MFSMPTIQLKLDLDFSLCGSLQFLFKTKAVKRAFGIAPIQLTLNFNKVADKSFASNVWSQFKKLIDKLCKFIRVMT